jgi:hypothetical protein
MENDANVLEIAPNILEIRDFVDTSTADKCPICGGDITPIGHCRMCENCYWSACEL